MPGVSVPEIRCAGFIIFRILGEFQYLLLQASDGVHHWTPPKGHLENDEDSVTAAQRETKEEAGLEPQDYDVMKDFPVVLEYISRGKTKRVDYWLAKLKDPNTPIKLSSEHQDFKWANMSSAAEMSFDNMKETLSNCEKYLQTKFKTS